MEQEKIKTILNLIFLEKLCIYIYIINLILCILINFLNNQNLSILITNKNWFFLTIALLLIIILKEIGYKKNKIITDLVIKNINKNNLKYILKLIHKNFDIYNKNKIMESMAKELTIVYDENIEHIVTVFAEKNKKEGIVFMKKEDCINEIQEEINELKKKQSIILGYNGDDLIIREEIAELEDKLKEILEEK